MNDRRERAAQLSTGRQSPAVTRFPQEGLLLGRKTLTQMASEAGKAAAVQEEERRGADACRVQNAEWDSEGES